MPPIKERKRTSLTAKQKKSIHLKKQANPKLRDEDIAQEYGCSRSTITKVLKEEKWKDVDDSSTTSYAKSAKQTMYPKLQEAMELWLSTAECRGLVLT